MPDDRYSVNPLDGPAQFAEKLRDIEQRISALEGAPITGTIRVRGPGGTFDVFHVDQDGMDAPQFPLPMNFTPEAVASYTTIANGAGWSLAARCILPAIVAHSALRCLVGYQFTAGSTGRLRLRSAIANDGLPDVSTTTSPTLAGAGGTAENVDWLHAIPLGESVPSDQFHYVDIEGIVDTGVGDLHVFEPSLTLMNPTHGATLAGVWTVV